MKYTKPILKWVGGKAKILDNLIETFPANMNNYHEIFVGGGSVLIAVLEEIQKDDAKIKLNNDGKVYAYDLNEPLINFYKNVQLKAPELYLEINKILKEYEKAPVVSADGSINRKPTDMKGAMKHSRESFYYWLRTEYNTNTTDSDTTVYKSAMFYIINKTCFRGMHRIGPNGYNVPYGNYKTMPYPDEAHLLKLQILFKDVTFECLDFENSISSSSSGDFIYLDPPYALENDKSFVGYNKTGFPKEKHESLFKLCNTIVKEQGVKIVMSNANVESVTNSFSDTKHFKIEKIVCRRAINSKKPESVATELIITSLNLT